MYNGAVMIHAKVLTNSERLPVHAMQFFSQVIKKKLQRNERCSHHMQGRTFIMNNIGISKTSRFTDQHSMHSTLPSSSPI